MRATWVWDTARWGNRRLESPRGHESWEQKARGPPERKRQAGKGSTKEGVTPKSRDPEGKRLSEGDPKGLGTRR